MASVEQFVNGLIVVDNNNIIDDRNGNKPRLTSTDSDTGFVSDSLDDGQDDDGTNGIFNKSTASSETDLRSGCVLFKGIAYSAFSSLFFSVSTVIVKSLDHIHPGELSIFRFCGMFVFCIPFVLCQKNESIFGPKEARRFIVLRGVAGSTNIFLRFYAYRHLPIGEASVIVFTVPVFVSLFACLCLKEKCSFAQTLCVILTIIGLLFICKVPLMIEQSSQMKNISSSGMSTTSSSVTLSDIGGDLANLFQMPTEHFYGISAALGSTIFAASVFIFIRKAKAVHFSIILFNFSWIAIIETTIITAALDGFSWPTAWLDWSLITLLSILSFLGQVCMTKSLQLEKAGPVAIVRSATAISLGLVWQISFFKQIPDSWTITGASLVTVCIILTSLRTWILTFPEGSTVRKRLFFLTN